MAADKLSPETEKALQGTFGDKNVSDADLLGAWKPTPQDALSTLYTQYPGLRKHDVQIKDSSVGGKDWQGHPYAGRQMEFYPPAERDNPVPGKPTIETFSNTLSSKDVLGELFSHYLPQVDPQFGDARQKFVQGVDDKQREMLRGDYREDLKSGVYGNEAPNFDKWLGNQGGDAFFRGYVADQYPKEYYRPDQVEAFDRLQELLKK